MKCCNWLTPLHANLTFLLNSTFSDVKSTIMGVFTSQKSANRELVFQYLPEHTGVRHFNQSSSDNPLITFHSIRKKSQNHLNSLENYMYFGPHNSPNFITSFFPWFTYVLTTLVSLSFLKYTRLTPNYRMTTCLLASLSMAGTELQMHSSSFKSNLKCNLFRMIFHEQCCSFLICLFVQVRTNTILGAFIPVGTGRWQDLWREAKGSPTSKKMQPELALNLAS